MFPLTELNTTKESFLSTSEFVPSGNSHFDAGGQRPSGAASWIFGFAGQRSWCGLKIFSFFSELTFPHAVVVGQ